jgi:hypothetical protein
VIRAPWTKEQVDLLNAYQARGDAHPYTCPGGQKACDGSRNLTATAEGWVCRCGAYRQNWAHDHLPAKNEGQ